MRHDFHDLRSLFETALGTPFTDGNRIEVLRNGDEIFPAMLEAIEQARHSIELLTFIYWKGDIAHRFAEALGARAKQGVAVRVLLDAFGAQSMSEELLERMRQGGVDIGWFRPLTRWKVWEASHRTHRKVLVVDGRLGFTGGVGIAEEWEGDARDHTEWRDTHFRIQGPAVRGLRGGFFGNWAETGRRVSTALAQVAAPASAGDVPVQIVRATASVGWSDVATMTELLMVAATRRLRIATAYFVPDPPTIDVLTETAARGVEIDIMLPGPCTDQRVSQLAGEDQYEPLLAAGVRLWAFQPTMLHTKIILVDDALACVGSANFNQRSMRDDDELCMVALDQDLVGTLDGHFSQDLERCKRLDLATWRGRRPAQRLKELLARPLRPQV